jgi:DNA sulfur modification protein DndD
MILDQIVIENFGVYGGRQEANLRPEPGRPIVLFGGMNGGGKTTLLDAIQLALYGPKARLSNRGRLPYRDYLKDSIHHGADPGDGASLTLRYRRHTDGEEHSFELQRSWRIGVKGIEETLHVLRDGLPDGVLTDHWDESIASYLPVRLAHLFFFDGEQIKDLAEGTHAAEIIGTAVEGLLGIDLLERLTLDLKGFERGKREEQRKNGQEDETVRQIRQAEGELAEIDRQLEAVAIAEGAKVNEANQLAKVLRNAEEGFQSAGGELYLRRAELNQEREALIAQKRTAEAELRELLAGPLPLALVDDLLQKVAEQASHESQIRHARVLQDALEERDRSVLDALKRSGTVDMLPSAALEQIRAILEEDRHARSGLANEQLILDTEDQLPARIQHLRGELIPDASLRAKRLTDRLSSIDKDLARLDSDLIRIPADEQIAELRERRETLKRQQKAVGETINRLGLAGFEARIAHDEQERMLKHSARVRDTLGRLRTRIVSRHSERIESLMFESFSRLLHKTDLIRGLKVEPGTFTPTLIAKDGRPLPIDRLSAGERQLLATAMLWGLARASGRPIPTIIDTPLGRLDSSHRHNLVERYFPNASHQVILLSTDEEIVGPYQEAISPFVTRTYLLDTDKDSSGSVIRPGYFPDDWRVRDIRAAYGS